MERLRMGVVGLRFGRHMVRDQIVGGNGAKWFELAACVDLQQELADELAAEYGVDALYDLDELLARNDIDVVALFTGPVGRANLIRRIIRAGKDVLTTKPFEFDPGAALDVLHEARRLGRVVHLNSPGPEPPGDLAQIMAWRRQYDLGPVIAARWETWVSYREKPTGTWLDDPELCPVAPVFRLGIYGINDLVRLMGEPETVQVMQSRFFTERPTVDTGQLAVRFGDGAIANFFATFCCDGGRPYRDSLVLNFAHGAIFRNIGPDIDTDKQPTRLDLVVKGQEEPAIRETVDIPREEVSGRYQWEACYRAVHGETLTDEVTPEQIVGGVKVIQAMARAAKSQQTERVTDADAG